MRDCNVHRMSVLASEEVLRRCEQRDILKVLKKGRMRRFGHAVRNEDEPLAK